MQIKFLSLKNVMTNLTYKTFKKKLLTNTLNKIKVLGKIGKKIIKPVHNTKYHTKCFLGHFRLFFFYLSVFLKYIICRN